tara:strand:+ start:23 stop:235 length:213 start_codon:yes stop_codon:yes gene_type:complete
MTNEVLDRDQAARLQMPTKRCFIQDVPCSAYCMAYDEEAEDCRLLLAVDDLSLSSVLPGLSVQTKDGDDD